MMKANSYERVLRRYAEYAPKYDRRWARYNAATLARALEAIPTNGAASVLDVACGTGILVEMLHRARPDLRITGVDLSPEMLQRARERLPERGEERVAWRIGRAESLPVSDAQFDIITCTNAFHLVRDGRAALAEFRRVLAPGGAIVLVDWCRDFLSIRGLEMIENLTEPGVRHVYSLDGISDLLREEGFTVEHRERFKANWFWGLMCVVARRGEEGALFHTLARSTPAREDAEARRHGEKMKEGRQVQG